MTALRRLAYVALALGYAQIVFGAVVRITGSGMGCGDDWPNCNAQWLPALDRPDVIIEFTHRIGALLLSLTIVALGVLAWRRRHEAGIGGPGGVLRPSLAAIGLVVVTALFGAVSVKLDLSPMIVVVHLVLAMALLAMLVSAAGRAGGFGAAAVWRTPGAASSAGTGRAAVAAAGLVFLVVLLGGLTANLPGAAFACRGFPFCGESMATEGGLAHIQLTHRVLAYLLALHAVGVVIGVFRRRDPGPVRWSAVGLLLAIAAQVAVAVVLVTTTPGAHLRATHHALGTLIWVLAMTLVVIAWQTRARPFGADSTSGPLDGSGTEERPRPPHTMAVWIARGGGH